MVGCRSIVSVELFDYVWYFDVCVYWRGELRLFITKPGFVSSSVTVDCDYNAVCVWVGVRVFRFSLWIAAFQLRERASTRIITSIACPQMKLTLKFTHTLCPTLGLFFKSFLRFDWRLWIIFKNFKFCKPQRNDIIAKLQIVFCILSMEQ